MKLDCFGRTGIVCAALTFGALLPQSVSAQTEEDRRNCFSIGTDSYKNKEFYDIGYAACDKFIKSQRFRGADLAAYVRQRADWLRRKGEYDAALRDFAWSIELEPNNVESYDFRGDVYVERGEFQRAIDDYNMSIRINANYAPAYYARGLAYEKLGRREDAIDSYKQALSKSVPQSPANTKRLYEWAREESRIRLDELAR